MKLHTKVESRIHAPADVVFGYLTDAENYPKLLTPLFPLAGLKGVELVDAAAPAVGVQRRVTMTDGMELVETIDQHEPMKAHGYSWGEGLKPPLSMIVNKAVARWEFSHIENATLVTWGYEFTLTSPLVWPVAKPIFMRFQTWMGLGLERAQDILETEST